MRVSQLLWHSFVPALFEPNGLAIDLGANHGEFAEYLADNFKRVLAVEPNPEISFAVTAKNIQLQRCAVGWPGGEAIFRARKVDVYSGLVPRVQGAVSDASEHLVRVVTFSELVSAGEVKIVDFVKMDVEGAELDILLNEPAEALCIIKQLTVEFHDFLDPASLPRIKQAMARMEALGFSVMRFSFSTYGDVLFLNRRYVAVGFLQKYWWYFRFKLCRGVFRRIRRALRIEGSPPPGYAFLR